MKPTTDLILTHPLMHLHVVGDISDIATTYLKLDCSNDPLTDTLEIRKSNDSAALELVSYDNDSESYSRLRFRKSDHISVLSETDAYDWLGIIQFEGCNTTPNFAAGARIWARQVDDAGAYIPADLVMDTYKTTGVNTDQIRIKSTGDVCLQYGAVGDVTLFENRDIGDDAVGKSLYIYRKAEEGDNAIRTYIGSDRQAQLVADSHFHIHTTVDNLILYADGGQVILQPYVDGDVECFGITDVGDDADGKSLYVHRKAEEGDSYLQMYCNDDTHPYIVSSTGTIYFNDDNLITSGTITGINVTSGEDPGHTHTGSSISGIDISADTNLTVTAPIVLTDDTFSLAADGVNDTHIDWGTEENQVSAVDIPIADSGEIITGTEVETALQENRGLINANTAKVTESTAVGDTNTVNLTLSTYTITADVIYQSSTTINLSDDENGLKADLNSIFKSNYDAAYTHIGESGASHTYINQNVTTTGTPTFGTTLFTDKIKFTQTDGNEYIDSLADGYLDLVATTSIRLHGLADTDDPKLEFVSGNTGYIQWQEDELQFHVDGGLETSTFVNAGGGVIFPTSDPHIVDAWWDNGGVLTKSAG